MTEKPKDTRKPLEALLSLYSFVGMVQGSSCPMGKSLGNPKLLEACTKAEVDLSILLKEMVELEPQA